MLYWELDSPTRLGHHKSISTMKGKWTVSALNQVFTLKENTKFGFIIMQDKGPFTGKGGLRWLHKQMKGYFFVNILKNVGHCWAGFPCHRLNLNEAS